MSGALCAAPGLWLACVLMLVGRATGMQCIMNPANPGDEVANASVVVENSDSTRTVVRFTCPDGYELQGAFTATCPKAGSATPFDYDYLGSDPPYCTKCPRGHFFDNAVINNTFVRATCSVCANDYYTHHVGSKSCWRCPTAGVTCAKGEFTVDDGWWFLAKEDDDQRQNVDGRDNFMVRCSPDSPKEGSSAWTEPGHCMFPCKGTGKGNPNGFCDKKNLSVALEPVRCVDGYEGVMCGGCEYNDLNSDRNFMRNGNKCDKCRPWYVSILVLVGLGVALLAGLFYILGFHNLATKPDDHSIVYQKSLFSFLQMVGALGVLKAKGTETFQEFFVQPATEASGTWSSSVTIKCLYGSAIYFGFLINMLLPIVISVIAAVMVAPMSYVFNKQRDKKRKAAYAIQAEARQLRAAAAARGGVDPDDLPRVPEAIGDPPARKLHFFPRLFPALYKLPADKFPQWLTSEMHDTNRREWRRVMRDDMAPFLGIVRLKQVLVFLIFILFPTLVGSVVTILNCTGDIDGKKYVAADLNERCLSGDHITFFVLAVIGGIVYGIGIPFGFLVLLLCKVEEDTEVVDLKHTESSVHLLQLAVDEDDDDDDDDETPGCCGRKKKVEDDDDSDSSESDSDSSDSDSSGSSSGSDSPSEDVEDPFSKWKQRDKVKRRAKKNASMRGGVNGLGEASGEEEEEDSDDNVLGWTTMWSDEHSCSYWMNDDTGDSVWLKPKPEGAELAPGEFILFTVTFCANPANDLTCPPSYIII